MILAEYMKILDKFEKNKTIALLDKEGLALPELLRRLIDKNYIIVICGPTGIGKSKIGINLAMLLNSNIISADSMQVYKNMNIGTDKLKTEKYGIKQFMTDIFEPDHKLSVVEFKNECREIIDKQFFKKKKVPIMLGGSGLYIKAVIDDIDKIPGEDENIRKMLNEEIEKQGPEKQYKKLKAVDREYADKININDKKRIIRALEVYETSGVPFSRYQKKWKSGRSVYNTILIGLEMERAALYKKIENRVDRMLKEGLVDEVRGLVDSGYKESYSLSQAVGYKELIAYLDGRAGLEESIEEIKKNTRRLAKKQLTWFRPDSRINWISLDSYDNIFDLMVEIFKIIHEVSEDEKN
jgi:tRNA dimethylallyltransferase